MCIRDRHRAARQHDGGDVHGRRGHQAGRRRLVAAGRQHHAVERIAVEHLDQAEIGEIAVERRGRPLAGLLDRMHRELEGDTAGIADAVAHARGKLEVMAIARREIGAGLRDADDWLAGRELRLGQSVVEIALEIERCHPGVVGIVEPQLRAQALRLLSVGRHRRASTQLVFRLRPRCSDYVSRTRCGTISAFTCVFHALWCCTADPGPPRGRSVGRSRVCNAPLRAALRPGHCE